MAVSRLDRLFILLDTGTTPVTRKAAAQQLGEVVKLHPHELHNLLSRVLTYLRSPNWDARIAAGQAVEAIVKNVSEWNPTPKLKQEPVSEIPTDETSLDRLSFDRFDISRLLKHGASLLGSAGAEFEIQHEKSGEIDPKERIAHQRKLLQKKLGLDMGAALGMNTEELFNDEDLIYNPSPAPTVLKQPVGRTSGCLSSRNHALVQAADLIEAEFQPGMSSRQKNKAKRMAKLFAKQRSRDTVEGNTNNEKCNDNVDGEPEEKRKKLTNVVIEQPATESKVLIDNILDSSSLFDESNEWPLESFCEELCNDLFNPAWEVRHGAGTGLREILKAHGKSGGKMGDSTLEEIEQQHQEWLEDLAIRLLCVFALDRFGDFVSDEVVAPVRETCAQTLGVVLKYMNERGVHGTVDVLLKLLAQEQWEVRHGGLLGIKYALAVRQDLIDTLLPKVLPTIIDGLQDLDDDVRAVAAAALVPVVENLVHLQASEVPFIVNTLWNALLELDDLTASTNSIMTLLSSLLTYRQIRQYSIQQSLTVLVPRVWPFLRHTISSVRKAALETLFTLLSTQDQSCVMWLTPILQDVLRHIYQSCILESNQEILELIQKVWLELLNKAPIQYVVAATCPWMGAWLCLMMQPSHLPIDSNMLLEIKAKSKEKSCSKHRQGQAQTKEVRQEYIAGSDTINEDQTTRDYVVTRTRLKAAKLLGALCCSMCEPSVNSISQEVKPAESLAQLLLFHLNSKSALQRIAVALVISEWATLRKDCIVVSSAVQPRLMAILSEHLYYDEIAIPFTRMQNECKQLIASLVEANCDVGSSVNNSVFTIDQANELVTTIFSEVTSTCDLNPNVIQQLDSKRQQVQMTVTETNQEWQTLHLRVHMFAACAVVDLQQLPEKLNPVIKPLMEGVKKEENVLVQNYAASCIAKLLQQCTSRCPCPNPKIVKNLCNSVCVDSTVTPSATSPVPVSNSVDNSKGPNSEKDGMHHTVNKTRGIITLYRHQQAAFALTSRRGPTPKALKGSSADIPQGSAGINLCEHDETQKPNLIQRRGAEYALTTIGRHFGAEMATALPYLWDSMVGLLRSHVDVQNFNGNVVLEKGDVAAQELVNSLQVLEITAAAMGSDIHAQAGIPDPPNMSEELIKQKARERHFLEQLLDGTKLENYKIPVSIKAELRKYQQDGVNWLAFLNKYKLHGILCDDMGLGKTLQSICILAGDHYLRAQEYTKTQSEDCSPLPSLVVCPPTLTGHWIDEVGKFCSKEILHPLHYTGPPTERARLQHLVKKHNLVVASYDVVRNDIDFFKNIKWSYCILDEGHVIKNGKTKLSKAVKQLTASYRLILSGTPIQNNVLELWSLFDFLMPGFLGTERQFAARYGKPILASRDARSSSREQEAGVLAMEALHRQVLPFLLRRMKEDVLQDLPPKIIQDYYCNLSTLQVQLYEDFAKSRAKCDVEETISTGTLSEENEKPKLKATGHVFQALQYLRKLCNHPALVLTSQHPEFQHIIDQLAAQNSSLHDIQHAPKLSALKQLLLDCGLGNSGASENGTESVVAQHRILIFCQLKSMLDIVEHDLLKPQMPSVTYLRLDGSVPAGQRHSIVARFNNDPSIDVLLLTTHVGGLGLNLTGADTVVFVEHDWNPMRDLQAMDRAHRIGQKRVVNVYRLITRGTLEEKIMGLQKFKMSIANTVISQENASFQSMGTDQLLDLFTLDKDGQEDKGSGSTEKSSMKAILENLGELWDQQQYDTEYNLDNFMHSLK
ncbi:TATA-binding protein-associated factor 172 isoform X3 [Heptranchias perlo]|uniref:TATA-binding protein-associated factor 172 isoform X3 n=1 Tax=Heptranchias perlo TaxID=212740 RepID=UPI003559BCC6